MRLRAGYAGCYMSDVVSVVITCYNQARFLREAIESILSQSYSNNEIIVMDDGSTDNTSQIAASYSTVRYIYQQNQGLSAARNTGLQQSRGEFVVFLDADDRLLPIALETGVECLHMDPDYAFAAGHYAVIRMDGSVKPLPSKPRVVRDPYLELLRGNYIGMHGTVMYRRSVFETVGLFDTSLKACEDYDMYFRITRKAPVYCHDKITAEYRHHDANMSRDRALMLKFSLKVLRSQRKYLVNHEQREALRIGTQFWRTLYGDRLIRDKRALIAGNDWRHTIAGIPMLLRNYPIGFARFAPYLSVRALVGAPRIFLLLARKFMRMF
jgi:glycosyltransferase involved in cell wall biosynthesis